MSLKSKYSSSKFRILCWIGTKNRSMSLELSLLFTLKFGRYRSRGFGTRRRWNWMRFCTLGEERIWRIESSLGWILRFGFGGNLGVFQGLMKCSSFQSTRWFLKGKPNRLGPYQCCWNMSKKGRSARRKSSSLFLRFARCIRKSLECFGVSWTYSRFLWLGTLYYQDRCGRR